MSQQTATFDPVEEGGSMTLMEHLIELRMRLMWIVGSLVVGTIIAAVFAESIINYISQPLLQAGGSAPQALDPTEPIKIFLKVSFTIGAAIAMPVIVYQIIAFVSPGLYPHEKRTLLLTLPGVMVLFVLGAAFSYYMLVPAAVDFLQNFLGTVIRNDWSIERYVAFVTRLVFWMGVFFETPLVVAFLARTGLVSGRALLKFWRQSIVIAAIVAAAITPTVDPVNMTLVMVPLLVLYGFSVGLAFLLYRPRTPRDFSQEPFIKE